MFFFEIDSHHLTPSTSDKKLTGFILSKNLTKLGTFRRVQTDTFGQGQFLGGQFAPRFGRRQMGGGGGGIRNNFPSSRIGQNVILKQCQRFWAPFEKRRKNHRVSKNVKDFRYAILETTHEGRKRQFYFHKNSIIMGVVKMRLEKKSLQVVSRTHLEGIIVLEISEEKNNPDLT